MNRTSLFNTRLVNTSFVICLAASMVATVGCASKNYVKQQTTPLINKTNELDDLTAKNSKDIKDVDARAQAGIAAVNAKTADVEQKAQNAGQTASSAQQMADAAQHAGLVLVDLFGGEDLAHFILAGGIADPGGPATHQGDRLVPGLLEPTEAHDLHEGADVKRRCGTVEADIGDKVTPSGKCIQWFNWL